MNQLPVKVYGHFTKRKRSDLGNHRLLEDFKASLKDEKMELVKKWQLEGQTVMYLLLENKVEGIIGVSDKIKETSADAIQSLTKNGCKNYYAYRRQ